MIPIVPKMMPTPAIMSRIVHARPASSSGCTSPKPTVASVEMVMYRASLNDHRSITTEQETTSSISAVRMVVGGQPVDAADGQTFDVVNPADGQVIAHAPLGGREDVDRAVAAAQKAFEDPKGWANWAAGKRGRTL